YDYARARVLLRALPGNNRSGPYIISFLKPLGKNPLVPPYLYCNLSAVPPDLVKMWMKYFQNQAAQERYWDENVVKLLVLKLRIAIGVAAEGLPHVQIALEELIEWREKVLSHRSQRRLQ